MAGSHLVPAFTPLLVDWGLISTVLTIIILVLIAMWLMNRSGGSAE